MIKSYIVDSTYNNMRLDRWLRNKIGNIPQSLIEKFLRSGKIKINKKKVKSSFKVKTNDKIDIFNLNFKESITQNKKKFEPSNRIIKSNVHLQNILQLMYPTTAYIDHYQIHMDNFH